MARDYGVAVLLDLFDNCQFLSSLVLARLKILEGQEPTSDQMNRCLPDGLEAETWIRSPAHIGCHLVINVGAWFNPAKCRDRRQGRYHPDAGDERGRRGNVGQPAIPQTRRRTMRAAAANIISIALI
jgi:hypothetical protein